MNQQELNTMQAAIASTLAAQGPPGGYSGARAWDPSNGVGLVKAGATDAFYYPVSTLAGGIAPAAIQNVSIAISADADFYCTHILQHTVNHASITGLTVSTMPTPLITVLITDTGSSRALMQGPIPVASIAGCGQLPYRLQYPRLFQRTTSINFQFTNFDTALTFDMTITLGGFKVYSNN
jgi:hypothetical protein